MGDENNTKDWKEIGNRAFQEKNYEEAIKAYTEGIKVTPKDASLYSNRAINYLLLQMYNLALADAESVLKIEPKHVKGIYRKVKSLIGSKKFGSAIEFILHEDHKEILNSYTPDKNLGDKLLEEATQLLDQERNGTYNMAQILREQTFYHEVADFNVPIAIELFKGRGRGLITTEKIHAGQLVIGSKAFAFIVERNHRKIKPPPPVSENQEDTSQESSNTENEEVPPPVEEEVEDYSVSRAAAKKSLITAVADKITKSPEEARVMYNLHAGKKLGHLELDDSLNTADLDRISKIVDCNALFTDGRLTYSYKELMYGLWLLPSFINHSCYDGNVKWHMHGDFLCVRAIKDIAAGEELLMSYVSTLESFETRKEILASYEIRCNCSLCNFQKKETKEVKEKVKSILKRYEEHLSGPGAMVSLEVSELECIVSELEGVHDEQYHKFCPFLLDPYKFLARRYFRKEEYEKSIDILEKGRNLTIGTDFTDIMVTFTTNIISSHLKNKNKRKAIEWIAHLKRDIQMCYGDPVDEVLQVIAPDILAKLKREKISID